KPAESPPQAKSPFEPELSYALRTISPNLNSLQPDRQQWIMWAIGLCFGVWFLSNFLWLAIFLVPPALILVAGSRICLMIARSLKDCDASIQANLVRHGTPTMGTISRKYQLFPYYWIGYTFGHSPWEGAMPVTEAQFNSVTYGEQMTVLYQHE